MPIGAATTFHTILECLITQKNAQKAIELTIERDINKAYSFYKHVRQQIFRNDSYRDPQYLQRLRHFQHVHFSPQDEAWSLLDSLLNAPLREQYRVETTRKPYLPSAPELDKALQQIHCLPPAFYDYVMPAEIIRRARIRDLEAVEKKHLKSVNVGNLQTILSKARNWRHHHHPWELVACASILCGRRTAEIVRCMQWEKESAFVARVQGLAKVAGNDAKASIPLLCSYEDFDELMNRIRELYLPTESSTNRLKPAMMRVFGQWFDHGQRRNLYAEAAFHERNVSGFFPDMSKVMWVDKALSHSSNVVNQALNLTYQSLTFRDG